MRYTIIILSGGKGTRIIGSIGNQAKILAPIGKRKFIEYLKLWIDKLDKTGKIKVILSTGHYHEQVCNYLQENDYKWKIVKESLQLGTLGAVNNCLAEVDTEDIIIMNGDTLIEENINSVISEYEKDKLAPLLVVKEDKRQTKISNYEINAKGYLQKRVNSHHARLVKSLGLLITKKEYIAKYATNAVSNNISQPMLDDDFLYHIKPKPYIISDNKNEIDIGTPDNYKTAQRLIPSIDW